MDFDRSPVLNLLRVAHRLEGRLTARLTPLDLSLSQLRVLWLVARSEGAPTVNQIREQMLDPASNVSRLLNKLMDARWIEKVRGLDDQRVVRVGLTDEGRRVLAKGGEALSQELAALDTLDDDQSRDLSRLLSGWI